MILKKSILLAVVACSTLGGSIASAQSRARPDQQENADFRGIYWKRGVGGQPNTVRITDGKIFMNVSEQGYREGHYMPAFERLPEQIVQRLPVRKKHDE
jgi:Ni/Co efflux regulator RcnB